MSKFIGTSKSEALNGSVANDSMFGGGGDDTLRGWGGSDSLEGGDGNDLLVSSGKYSVVKGSFTWEKAKAHAEAAGGHLVTMKDSAEGALVARELKAHAQSPTALELTESLWLGAYRAPENSAGVWGYLDGYKWVTDEPFSWAWSQGVFGSRPPEKFPDPMLLQGLRLVGEVLWTDESFGGLANGYIFESPQPASGNSYLLGGAGNDTLQTSDGNDTLNGGNGNDLMFGGEGDDLYVVDSLGDVLLDLGGIDAVQSSVSLELADAFENLSLIGTGSVNATGNALNNLLMGNSGANRLSGGGGADTMIGGAGDDIYVLEDLDCHISETFNGGKDAILFRVYATNYSYSLPENFENLFGDESNGVVDLMNFTAIGNSLPNWIGGFQGEYDLYGGNGDDTLSSRGSIHASLLGGQGNDLYIIDGRGDASLYIVEGLSEGVDTVRVEVANVFELPANVEHLLLESTAKQGLGNSLANRITGNSEANTLDGAAGADTLFGASGDDVYIVDNLGDLVVEKATEGLDLVRSSVSLLLAAQVENVELTGFRAINGAGNALNNRISGNSAANLLDGGSGNDTLMGNQGNDTYIVNSSGDVVAETRDGGVDLVQSSLTHELSANFEDLVLLGVTAIDGTGNSLANRLTGNTASNVLDGKSGSDTLTGGGGNDIYLVDDSGDRVVEIAGQGIDIVRSVVTHSLGANLETLELMGAAVISGTGNSLSNTLQGNSAANRLDGGSGNDLIIGGINDTLVGGDGEDTLSASAGAITVNGGGGSDSLVLNWATPSGSVFEGLGVRTDGKSYSGTYQAKSTRGNVISSAVFSDLEKLFLNGRAIDLFALAVPGVTVRRSSDAGATTEQGGKVQYDVLLNRAPREKVSVVFASTDATEGKVITPVLTFTPDNYSLPQKLVLQGVDDYLNDGDVAFSVTGRITTEDLTYNRVVVPSIGTLNTDDGEDKPIFFPSPQQSNGGVDYLQGKNGDDILYAGGGQDQVMGGRGNDEIYGQEDNDRLLGEDGNDELYGGYGRDTIDGGAGADSLFGEQGLDTLFGGAGNDYLDGGLLNDSMSGGAGNDTYLVDSTGDVINDLGMTTDVDTVQVIQTINYTLPANLENAAITAGGNGNLTGNTLNNGLIGNDGRNVIDGGVGNDRLDGAGGADSLLGGAGNDAFVGGGGNDTMRGGIGVDLADFLAAGVDLRVDLSIGRVTGDGTDLLFDIENILAGDGQDTLLGNAAGNDLDGGAGTDNLNGGGGNDTLAGCFFGANGGRSEIDTLTGGAGNDLFQLGFASGRFYDDGISSNAGRSDYVLITDFTVGQDRLQLDGAAGNYYLGASGVSEVGGIGLYAEQGATDELIAIIRGANATTLTAANTINPAQFV